MLAGPDSQVDRPAEQKFQPFLAGWPECGKDCRPAESGRPETLQHQRFFPAKLPALKDGKQVALLPESYLLFVPPADGRVALPAVGEWARLSAAEPDLQRPDLALPPWESFW